MNDAVDQAAINICGVLVHAARDRLAEVQTRLGSFAGLEIHEVTAEGRMIITLDLPDRMQMADTINDLNKIEGVLSAAMVYQHSE
ncbi:MAG: chaperone NapD [Gammaproteobacteria bacterium]|nr:chaperone NapD [Gammaproteobacteria bacterium]MDH5653265.1 chaperone NapD [Gammaproteobacteria bacterium]